MHICQLIVCNCFRQHLGGDQVYLHQSGGRGREAGWAHGRPLGRVRGPQHEAGEAHRGPQGGDQDLPEVGGATQTYRELGVCQERHHEVPHIDWGSGEGEVVAGSSNNP